MHALILLLTGLVCAQAAPQFVFVLPPEFLKQMQKPVGEMPQPGQQPRIPFFPLESLLGSSSRQAEIVVPAPVISETLQATKRLGVPTSVVEEQQHTTESVPVVTDVPTTDVVPEAASETIVQTVKEESVAKQIVPIEITMAEEAVPVAEETPAVTTMVQEAAPFVQEATTESTMMDEVVPVAQETPAEVAIMEEVVTVVQEVSTDTPVQEVTTDPTIAIQTTEPTNMGVLNVTPVEEVVTPAIAESVTEKFAIAEEVVIVEDVMSNTAQEVVIVEEVIPNTIVATTQRPVVIPNIIVATSQRPVVIPNTIVATTQGPVAVTAGPVSSIKKKSFSAPINQVVDPRFSVDPRFRNYIYENDAPDIVAAKIALFKLQAASLPRQPVQ